MTAELLALLDSDPAAGILAAADLREKRAKAAAAGPWAWDGLHQVFTYRRGVAETLYEEDAEHIAAEATPAHSLTAVRRWRGVVERHVRSIAQLDPPYGFCRECQARWAPPGATTAWPCPEIRETADEAKAYLGGAP